MNLTAIISVIGLVVGTAFGWQLQADRIASIQLELQNERTDRANEHLAIQRASSDAIAANAKQVKQAQVDAATRNDRLAADLRRTAGQLDSLRIASEAAVRNADSSIAACTGTLATHAQLLSQCSSELVKVSGEADGWVSGLILWQEAWPKE